MKFKDHMLFPLMGALVLFVYMVTRPWPAPIDDLSMNNLYVSLVFKAGISGYLFVLCMLFASPRTFLRNLMHMAMSFASALLDTLLVFAALMFVHGALAQFVPALEGKRMSAFMPWSALFFVMMCSSARHLWSDLKGSYSVTAFVAA